MAIETLEFGQSVAGLIRDGVPSRPYVGATLKLDNPRGVVVEVPYIYLEGEEQFRHVAEWFRRGTPPQSLMLETPYGPIGLFGITRRRESIRASVSLGQLAPRETILGGYEAPLDEPLVLDEVQSRIDGLREWTELESVDFTSEADGSLLVDVRIVLSDSWNQGDAVTNFTTHWRAENPRSGLRIDDDTVLVTRFSTPRPFIDHLAEHKKVMALITLISGAPMRFREHRVSAESIGRRSLVGTNPTRSKVVLISADTVRDYSRPVPSKSELQRFLVDFERVGSAGMEQWSNNYKRWQRFIFPAVEVLGRNEALIDDVIVSLSMSIEAAGQLIGKQAGEEETYSRGRKPRATTATNVYRCLRLIDVDWGDLTVSSVGLAYGVANAYNDIKHFDRGGFPDFEVAYVVSVIVRYIVRLVTLYIVDDSEALLEPLRKDRALIRLLSLYPTYGITFQNDGSIVRLNDA